MAQSDVQADATVNQDLDRIQRWALIVGGAGLVLAFLGAFLDADQFYRAYLFAYLFWLGISLGSLLWLLVYHMTGGAWGVAIRRVLEANILVTILMAVLFIPLLFGLPSLYSWARPGVLEEDAMLQGKGPYLNVPFFLARVVLYFVVWIGLGLLLNRWSRQQEESTDPATRDAINLRLRQFGGPGIVLYGLTMTFAAFDWVMSLEPHWYSSIYGVLVISGQVLTALTFCILVLAWLTPRTSLLYLLTTQQFNDLGNFLLGATLFWMYIAFSQYLIIWSGNLPEEVVWYLARLEGGWQWVALLLLIFHFALPFALLLSSRLKRQPRRLVTIAAILFVADLLHLYWLVEPAFHPGDFAFSWLALVTPFGIGGLWLYGFIWSLRRRPLLPAPLEPVSSLPMVEHATEQAH